MRWGKMRVEKDEGGGMSVSIEECLEKGQHEENEEGGLNKMRSITLGDRGYFISAWIGRIIIIILGLTSK